MPKNIGGVNGRSLRLRQMPSHMQRYDAPAAALSELRQALNAPRTLTAILLGDPLPGRSALDKERAHADTSVSVCWAGSAAPKLL